MISLACSLTQRDNAPVLFNSGTSFDRLTNLADSRPLRHFLRPFHAIAASISMAGHGGDTFGYAGSKFRSVNPAMRLPPPFDSGRQAIQTNLEATMPSITLRAIRALSPITHTISTAATMAEAQIIARLHLARTGHAVRIAPAAIGFTVAEVR